MENNSNRWPLSTTNLIQLFGSKLNTACGGVLRWGTLALADDGTGGRVWDVCVCVRERAKLYWFSYGLIRKWKHSFLAINLSLVGMCGRAGLWSAMPMAQKVTKITLLPNNRCWAAQREITQNRRCVKWIGDHLMTVKRKGNWDRAGFQMACIVLCVYMLSCPRNARPRCVCLCMWSAVRNTEYHWISIRKFIDNLVECRFTISL